MIFGRSDNKKEIMIVTTIMIVAIDLKCRKLKSEKGSVVEDG